MMSDRHAELVGIAENNHALYVKEKQKVAELVKALKWYHCEGQDMAMHRRAVPNCSDCALIAKAEGR